MSSFGSIAHRTVAELDDLHVSPKDSPTAGQARFGLRARSAAF
jgi:hypothetical protein